VRSHVRVREESLSLCRVISTHDDDDDDDDSDGDDDDNDVGNERASSNFVSGERREREQLSRDQTVVRYFISGLFHPKRARLPISPARSRRDRDLNSREITLSLSSSRLDRLIYQVFARSPSFGSR